MRAESISMQSFAQVIMTVNNILKLDAIFTAGFDNQFCFA